MPDIYLIRHGMTEGNKKQRYIGTTDEPLCPEGKAALTGIDCPEPESLFVSPLLRCRETAEILFPGKMKEICPGLSECDFGDFENKNYLELSHNPDYQAWVDSNGTLPFPNGESRESFRWRTLEEFNRIVEECFKKEINTAALVVHGGTIMNIMEAYGSPARDFYDWHVKNGRGYLVQTDRRLWKKKILNLIKEL